ncbi:HAD hydrolase family protein [Streptacidiphilus sp. 4-A2]|nr:HAD hydrolase family protein [Streptacidiphilus sp. 4-A2]
MTGERPFDLIATDLDGTLLTSDKTVSERTRQALARAVAAGAVHIVVTGRSAAWTRPTLDAIGYTGLAVCGQGAQLYDAGEHRELTSVTLDRQLAQVALAKIEAETGPLRVAVMQDGLDGEFLRGPGYQLPGTDPTRQCDPAELWSAPVTRLFLQHPGLSNDELARTAAAIAGQLVDVVLSGPGFIEVLRSACPRPPAWPWPRPGWAAARAIAFGDMPNDLPMFRWAAHGVAMANAHPTLLAAADEVTLSNNNDGVAAVLDRLFPQA